MNKLTKESPREWLYPLDFEDEQSPLLSPSEKQLIEDVCSKINKSANSDFSSSKVDPEVREKILAIEENLKIIVRELSKNRKLKDEFIRKYPGWRKIRGQSVQSLEDIGNCLHTHRRNCNIFRLVGNSTSLGGGILCVASAIMVPFTLGLSTPFAIAGGVTVLLGSSTSIGASLTEVVLQNNNIKEVRAIIEKDKTEFEFLKAWLNSVDELTEAIESISAYDVDKSIEFTLQILNDFWATIRSIFNRVNRTTQIRSLAKTLLKEQRTSQFITISPCLISLLLVIALLVNKSNLNENKPWITLVKGLSSAANISLNIIGPMLTTFLKGDLTLTLNIAKAVVRGTVAVIGMTFDVASIVLTSIDVHKGSLSKEGSTILKIAQKMKEEADCLDKIYAEISR